MPSLAAGSAGSYDAGLMARSPASKRSRSTLEAREGAQHATAAASQFNVEAILESVTDGVVLVARDWRFTYEQTGRAAAAA